MNKIWTADKTQLSVSTLKSLLLLKCNFKQSCLEFYNFLKSSPELLKKIISSEKYKQWYEIEFKNVFRMLIMKNLILVISFVYWYKKILYV